MFQMLGVEMKYFETQILQVQKDVKNPILMEFDKIEDPYFPSIAGPFSATPLIPVLFMLHDMVVDIIDDFAMLLGFRREDMTMAAEHPE